MNTIFFEHFMSGTMGIMTIIFLIIGLIISILWAILPFAIFGIKPKLDEIKKEIESSNKRLDHIANELKVTNKILNEISQKYEKLENN